jgi:hypothetical protein
MYGHKANSASTATLQRDLVDENAAAKVKSEDVVYELMAHKLAYKGINGIPEAMGDWLETQGYERAWRGSVQGSGLFCGLIMPKAENIGVKPPVLTFKGTTPSMSGDVLADVDPVSVGFTAFKAKQKAIQALIAQAGGKVVVTGHSLGGALAQHAASAFTSNVSKVVTFQAPGISQEQTRQFNQNVGALDEEDRPEVVHHLATGDIVDLAGGKHLGGSGLYTGKGQAQFFLHHLASAGPKNHSKFLLQDGAFQDQQREAGVDDTARGQLGLSSGQTGQHEGVVEYNDNPFAGNQFVFERGRELASPGTALMLGGAELAKGGMGLAKEGTQNWKAGGFTNRVKGLGKMAGGAVGALAGGATAIAGGVGALGGALVGGTAGAVAVGGYKTVQGMGEGAMAGADLGSQPGRALVSGGADLAKAGRQNWRKGGFFNRLKGAGQAIGGGVTAGVGGLVSGVGGVAGGAIGGAVGGLTAIPKALWKRAKRL